jgi:flavin reductase ActVB
MAGGDVRDAPDVVERAYEGRPAAFHEAMKRFASGVTIVTTVDTDGSWKGFTASAFCSLSIEPPLILVCQARTSSSYEAFVRCERFIVNILGSEHEELALKFARSGGDKFSGERFQPGRFSGLPVLPDALAVVGCDIDARYEGGDHDIVIGRVYCCQIRDGAPMLHFDSRFHGLAEGGD